MQASVQTALTAVKSSVSTVSSKLDTWTNSIAPTNLSLENASGTARIRRTGAFVEVTVDITNFAATLTGGQSVTVVPVGGIPETYRPQIHGRSGVGYMNGGWPLTIFVPSNGEIRVLNEGTRGATNCRGGVTYWVGGVGL